MAINVNYYDEVIYITSPTTTVTVQELIDAVRASEDSVEGMSFGGPVATLVDAFADAEGSVNVGAGYFNPITMTLDSNWYIEFWDGVGLGTVADGNVSGGKDNRPVRCAVGSSDTALVLGAERGIQVSGGSGASAQEVWEYDISSTSSGAGFILKRIWAKIKFIVGEL